MNILTQDGFKEFDGIIDQGYVEELLIIQFHDGSHIKCTYDHKFLINEEYINAVLLDIGDNLNGKTIINIDEIEGDIVYDMYNVKDTHAYISNGVISHNCNFVYIDETSFVENWEEFYSSVYPTISSGKSTKILFTSTPNGLNHFYEFWSLAHKGQESDDWNGFNPIKVEWDEVPGRDEEWKQKTLRAMNFNITKFNVEFACQFEGSSQTLISGAALRRLDPTPPIAEEQFIKQYERVEPGHMYALIADVARGVGGDHSAFSVIDISQIPYKQVCVFRDNMTNGIDYAQFIHRFAKYYNNAHVLVEINDNGQQISDLLHHEYEYENIISTKSNGRSGKKATLGGGLKMDRGIRTTKTVKNIGCTMLQMLVENDKIIIKDTDTIHELSKFVKVKNTYRAESGFHDDIVMGLVLFSWLTDQSMFKELTDEDILKHLRAKTDEQVMDSLLPFGVNAQMDEHEFESYYDIEPEIINW